ncbi:MAG: flippase-like domain-containing protein [Bacteroidia bacterium]|nr:flippase-like domain-containing protein [Bacteroidia bacterium]
MKLNRNIKIFVNYFLGPLLFVWLSWTIYWQIKNQPDLTKTWLHVRESFSSPLVWNLFAVIVLMVINWFIETIKWKLAIKKIQHISFLKAFKAVLSGVSFSVSSPNRVGEYLGRLLYVDEGNRLKAISLTIVSNISQLIITLLFGCMGLIILFPKLESGHIVSDIWIRAILYGVLAVLVILTLFYFRLPVLVKWIDRWPGSRRYAYLIKALEEFDATLLIQLLSLSAVRFIVFTVQYYLLFRLFDVPVFWWQGFWTVSVSFLVLAIIPTIAIIELFQRRMIVNTIVGLYSANELGITLTTAGIWFINLIVPAITGSLLILSIKKIFKNKDEKT